VIRYRLANGVTLQENSDQPGGILSIRYPRRIIRLSPHGVSVVKQLCGQGAGPEGWDKKLADFAATLENQGILIRLFPKMADELLPVVSIVIPTYNRHKMLASCIGSLLALDYPKEKLEIIVVDDASPVSVDLACDQTFVRLIRLTENGGPGAARNEAVKFATGEIIAFLDDDCLAGKAWLRALVPCFQDPDVAAAGGRVESASLNRPLDKYEQYQSPLLMGDNQRKLRKGSSLSYLATCNLLVRKKALLAVGGFEPRLRVGEDVDLCWRLLEKGGGIYYIPEGVIYHHHRSELVPFLKRRFHYGQSEAMLQSRYLREKRRLFFFPGNGVILFIAILVGILAGVLPALAAGSGLAILNLFFQSVSKLKSIRSAGCKPGFRQVFLAILRSQWAGIYLAGQQFARYYSIPAILIALPVHPGLVPFFLAFHALPGIADYIMKKPSLAPGPFIFCHILDNTFYQAGVFSGCLKERNLRPLAVHFIRADANLYQRTL